MLLLTVLTILLIVVFAAVLIAGVAKIMWALESMGNAPTSTPGSLLAKIRWGVRAIEQQSVAIGPQARRLKSALGKMDDSINGLSRDIAALGSDQDRQKG